MSNLTDVMMFNDLTLIEVPVEIKGIKYRLIEASAEAAARYRNHAMSCTTFNGDGKPTGVKGLGDIQALLVSLCLFRIVPKDTGEALERVSLDFVKGLTERIVKPLFERAKAISELGEETDESIEGLEKQITELQEKLDLARSKAEVVKNEQPSTESQSS